MLDVNAKLGREKVLAGEFSERRLDLIMRRI